MTQCLYVNNNTTSSCQCSHKVVHSFGSSATNFFRFPPAFRKSPSAFFFFFSCQYHRSYKVNRSSSFSVFSFLFSFSFSLFFLLFLFLLSLSFDNALHIYVRIRRQIRFKQDRLRSVCCLSGFSFEASLLPPGLVPPDRNNPPSTHSHSTPLYHQLVKLADSICI